MRLVRHAVHVSGMFTANSMNCLCEVLGMALPGNGTIPAVYSERIRLAKHAGMKIMELLEKNIKPRDIITPDSIYNAFVLIWHLAAVQTQCCTFRQ